MKSSNKEVAAPSSKNVVAFDRGVLSKGISVAKEVSPPGGSNADIMKVTTDGNIVMGMDQEPVDAAEEWVVNPGLIYMGFICWKDGKPIDQKHRNFSELAAHGAYSVGDLEDHGPYTSEMDGWSEQTIMGLLSKKDGLPTVFPATSLGGRQAIQKVVEAIGKQDEVGSDYLVPIIKVSADSYFNKKFRKDIYFPVFDVVRWENESGDVEGAL